MLRVTETLSYPTEVTSFNMSHNVRNMDFVLYSLHRNIQYLYLYVFSMIITMYIMAK